MEFADVKSTLLGIVCVAWRIGKAAQVGGEVGEGGRYQPVEVVDWGAILEGGQGEFQSLVEGTVE